MLNVQKYLSGNTLDQLVDEFKLIVCRHPSLPLVILNYDQIESPRNHPITNECRGLILEMDTWKIVSKGFNRFFNWEEYSHLARNFKWENCWASSKEDGSYMQLFNYNDNWMVATRGSFADGQCGFSGKTWEELFFDLLDRNRVESLDHNLTYVFEFWSPHNKIVRTYEKSCLFLLAICDNILNEELVDLRKDLALYLKVNTPKTYKFSNIDEVVQFVREMENSDPTFEGVVLCDSTGERWKVKSATYLALHRLRGNNDFSPKNLVPIILAGENPEIEAYFPEIKDKMDSMRKLMDNELFLLEELWNNNKGIVLQKDFALGIVGKSRFTSMLFQARKTGQDIKEIWRNSEEFIIKVLF